MSSIEPTPDATPESGLSTVAEAVVGAANGGGAYAVKLPVFEGPLDLLLHLIRQNEVEITDIPVALIGKQYLDYLEMMHELNLDVAADYLVMAATLALIKSRMLLPPDGDADDEEALDPRAELVARLLEYQRFKEVADELAKRRLLERDVFRAHGLEPDAIPESEREISVGLFQLLEAFRDVLNQSQDTGPAVHEVESETITVRDQMISVMERMQGIESIEFHQLFEAPGGAQPTRALVIATFLAILELTRLTALRIYQGITDEGVHEGPIRLRPVIDSDTRSWSDRITELM